MATAYCHGDRTRRDNNRYLTAAQAARVGHKRPGENAQIALLNNGKSKHRDH
jgi:hypothetical protein